MKNINNYKIKEKKILLRVDLNVPVVGKTITDKSRIVSLKSTIKKLIDSKNKIFLLSHFGRPKGRYDKRLSLEFICPILAKEFEVVKINFIKNLDSEEIKITSNNMSFGEICLLENIRFYEDEEKNDLKFAKELSKNFDIYINDAFSASHRSHASIVGITNFLPSIAGNNMLHELNNLEIFFKNPKKPNTAIIGGSKISTKIALLNHLVENFDNIIIVGAMANTFLLANGFKVGRSLVEKQLVKIAQEIMIKAKNYNCNLVLPIDVVCSNNLQDVKNIRKCNIENVFADQMILDVGKKTIANINKVLLLSSMILWNGPLGAFEYAPFNQATIKMIENIKKNINKSNVIILAGGGDTVSAIRMAKAYDSFTYVSNAGGAFLEWLEGKESPGVRALKENQQNYSSI